MQDQESSTERLVAEFKRITEAYEKALHELPRRSEIAWTLVSEGRGRTHKEVGQMLGISAGRVHQLIKEAPGYVPQRIYPPSEPS